MVLGAGGAAFECALAARVVGPYADAAPCQLVSEGGQTDRDSEELLAHDLLVAPGDEGVRYCPRWRPVCIRNPLVEEKYRSYSGGRSSGIAGELGGEQPGCPWHGLAAALL